ncbi:hypothetical protein ACIQZB_44180 [Streptomyces sp. NPDC097727]|uniref:hypothetical protein n=1 Tax=Streptomyces sp. NPDC097727 TaxID=3366092 RepID=UPI00382D8B1B
MVGLLNGGHVEVFALAGVAKGEVRACARFPVPDAHQPSSILRPLVLGKGVQKEPLSVLPTHLRSTAPPERHHVGETRLTRRRSVGRCASGNDQQVTGIGICHEHTD